MPPAPAQAIDPLPLLAAALWRDGAGEGAALVERCSAWGLEGLALALADRGLATLDAAERVAAERQRAAAASMQTWFEATLREVCETLGAAGVPVAVLKGHALGERLYPAPVVRRSSDIDLLVPEPALDRALAVLAGLGYRAGATARDRAWRRCHHHVTLQRSVSPTIEVHFALLAGFGARIEAAGPLERARGVRTRGGVEVMVLALEDEMVYLAAHAAAHLFERSTWALEVGLLAASRPDLDWVRVRERAVAWHVRRALSASLTEAARHFGRERLPAEAHGSSPTLGNRIAAACRSAFLARPRHTLPRYAAYVGGLAATCDNPFRAAWFLQHELLRAAGEAARKLHPGLAVAAWPPLPPWPPWERGAPDLPASCAEDPGDR